MRYAFHTGGKGENKVRKSVFQILLLASLLTFLGCASSLESRITGKWVCKSSGDRMDLSGNHTCTVYSMGVQYTGKWTSAKSDIKIDAGQVMMVGKLDGNTIVAEDVTMHNKYVYEKIGETKK